MSWTFQFGGKYYSNGEDLLIPIISLIVSLVIGAFTVYVYFKEKYDTRHSFKITFLTLLDHSILEIEKQIGQFTDYGDKLSQDPLSPQSFVQYPNQNLKFIKSLPPEPSISLFNKIADRKGDDFRIVFSELHKFDAIISSFLEDYFERSQRIDKYLYDTKLYFYRIKEQSETIIIGLAERVSVNSVRLKFIELKRALQEFNRIVEEDRVIKARTLKVLYVDILFSNLQGTSLVGLRSDEIEAIIRLKSNAEALYGFLIEIEKVNNQTVETISRCKSDWIDSLNIVKAFQLKAHKKKLHFLWLFEY